MLRFGTFLRAFVEPSVVLGILTVALTVRSVGLFSYRRFGSFIRRFDSSFRRSGSSIRLSVFFPSLWVFYPSLRLFFPSLWQFYPSLRLFFPSVCFPSVALTVRSVGRSFSRRQLPFNKKAIAFTS
ncbi:hypothetical protein [Lysinibacillus sphaericus]|uniref:hypothetical protein n=1 Tax=Lysinibacillus sphaericus TaxID=1421 RepID=UPI0018CDA993|nr:hypothetical protein [Lysinibacillus sphaericus]